MPRIRSLFVLALLAGSAGACDEAPDPVAPPPDALEPLYVSTPSLSRSQLVESTFRTLEPSPTDPTEQPAPISELEYDEPDRPLQEIFDADTRVGFEADYAWSMGIHSYIGNVGYVSTRADVAASDQDMGHKSSERQDYTPFLTDFGRVKSIWTQAKVHITDTCGLSVQGESKHKAWWQFFTGTSVAAWGTALRTTDGGPVSQAACQRQTGTGKLTTDGPSGTVCYYYIVYDLQTLEILSADLLYCSSAGGELI